MIVKVQQSITTSDARTHVLLYNKSRNVFIESYVGDGTGVAEMLLPYLGDSLKKYLKVTIENGVIYLEGEAPTQNW